MKNIKYLSEEETLKLLFGTNSLINTTLLFQLISAVKWLFT